MLQAPTAANWVHAALPQADFTSDPEGWENSGVSAQDGAGPLGQYFETGGYVVLGVSSI